MRAYNATPRLINLGCVPAVPELVWSYERRKAMSLDRCRGKEKTPGRKRRHRRETTTRGYLVALRVLQGAGSGLRTPSGEYISRRLVLEQRYEAEPPWVEGMRSQLRRLVALAVKHGPASGWGVAQPDPTERQRAKWTPYWVAKKAEKCWRWWRALMLVLFRLLVRLAHAVRSLVPLHRAHLEEPAPKEEPVLPEREREEALPRCRDKSAGGWREAARRLGEKIGALPSGGSQEAPIER